MHSRLGQDLGSGLRGGSMSATISCCATRRGYMLIRSNPLLYTGLMGLLFLMVSYYNTRSDHATRYPGQGHSSLSQVSVRNIPLNHGPGHDSLSHAAGKQIVLQQQGWKSRSTNQRRDSSQYKGNNASRLPFNQQVDSGQKSSSHALGNGISLDGQGHPERSHDNRSSIQTKEQLHDNSGRSIHHYGPWQLQGQADKVQIPQYRSTSSRTLHRMPTMDPSGYLLFCLCMGNVGNQVDQLLGSFAFAKELNRTLVVPPLAYNNVPFTDWFKFQPLLDYHRMISAEDFMEHIAPEHWPPDRRTGICLPPFNPRSTCNMKNSQTPTSFWDNLQVDFPEQVTSSLSYHDGRDVWDRRFPADLFPVLALQGAPADYPIRAEHRGLQRLLTFSDNIQQVAKGYINKTFPGMKFVGIHLRNGNDWVISCEGADRQSTYHSSPQCLEGTGRSVTNSLCLPPDKEIFRLTRKTIINTGARVVYVATDRRAMIRELQEELQEYQVSVYNSKRQHMPIIDLAILTMSDHFIGNCVSSFTAFVKRARDVAGKPTSFWGFS